MFVNIYDLTFDAISLTYHYMYIHVVCSVKIRNATIFVVEEVSGMFWCVYVWQGVCMWS